MSQVKGPDYVELVALLPTLRRLPDAAGIVTLEPKEAERIKALGFHAQAGPWCVPRLPSDLVACNPLLAFLGDDVDPFWHPRHAELEPSYRGAEIVEQGRVASVDVATGAPEPLDGLTEQSEALSPTAWTKECAAILAAITRTGGKIERRTLQKKRWRIKAEQFNGALESLRRRGLIQIDGNLVVQSPDQADSALFHGVPQTNDGVPRVESAPGLTGAPDQVSEIRGSAPRKMEHPDSPCKNNAMQRK